MIAHVRDRVYMSGVDRDNLRVKSTGEVFTPTAMVQHMLEQLPREIYQDPDMTFLDNSCGDGQFLGEILIRRLEHGIPIQQALATLYGIDLMLDNVDLCRHRLICGLDDPKIKEIVDRNIVWANALTYDHKFGPMTKRKAAQEARERRRLSQIRWLREQNAIRQKLGLPLLDR